MKSLPPLVFAFSSFFLLFSPLLSQDLERIEKVRYIHRASESYHHTPSRTQAVLTSLLPIPFGNRIFYDGVDRFVNQLIPLGEGAALMVGGMAGLVLVLNETDEGGKKKCH